MDVLINFDEHKYQSEKKGLESFIPQIQKAVNAFNSLGLESLKSHELEQLFIKTDELVFDKMTEQKPVIIEGKEVHKNKALELFKKPAGYENLVSTLQETVTIFGKAIENNKLKRVTINQLYKIYELNKKGIVIFKTTKDDEIKEYYKKYAKTDRAKKLLELANVIIKECKDPVLTEAIKWNPNGIGNILNHIVSSKYGNGELTLNVEGIMWYNQK